MAELLDPAHQDGLRRLERKLRSAGGRLVFAVGAAPSLAAAVCEKLGAAELALAPDEERPWTRLPEQAARVVLSVPADATSHLLARLNLGRELIKRRRLQLVLWLRSLDLLDQVRLAAPDLWSHRAAFIPFLSEADLSVEQVGEPASLAEQLDAIEGVLARARELDKADRFRARAGRVLLLREAGRFREAEEEVARLERTYKRMAAPDRWALQEAMDTARGTQVWGRPPHLSLADARAELSHPQLHVRVRGWLRSLPALEALGALDELAEAIEHEQPFDHYQANRAIYTTRLGLALGRLDLVEAGLQAHPAGFERLSESDRALYELRGMGKQAVYAARGALLAGDWLAALRQLQAAAQHVERGGTALAMEALNIGHGIALDVGLVSLSRGWLVRSLELAEATDPGALASVLSGALVAGSLPEDHPWANGDRLVALARGLADRRLQAQLFAAIGIALSPDLGALSLELGEPDAHTLARATWWIDRIGSRTARRRLAEIRGLVK